jgi:hypothetical protein
MAGFWRALRSEGSHAAGVGWQGDITEVAGVEFEAGELDFELEDEDADRAAIWGGREL